LGIGARPVFVKTTSWGLSVTRLGLEHFGSSVATFTGEVCREGYSPKTRVEVRLEPGVLALPNVYATWMGLSAAPRDRDACECTRPEHHRGLGVFLARSGVWFNPNIDVDKIRGPVEPVVVMVPGTPPCSRDELLAAVDVVEEIGDDELEALADGPWGSPEEVSALVQHLARRRDELRHHAMADPAGDVLSSDVPGLEEFLDVVLPLPDRATVKHRARIRAEIANPAAYSRAPALSERRDDHGRLWERYEGAGGTVYERLVRP
jgi:hypothetical protein